MLKKVLFFLSFVILLVSSVRIVQAAGDILSPVRLAYHVSPGEQFSLDLSFLSAEGGEYDVILYPFSYDNNGDSSELEDVYRMLELQEDFLIFKPNEERYIPVSVNIPDKVPTGDYHYYMGFRKRASADFSYELSTRFHFAIGSDFNIPEGNLFNVDLSYSEGSGTDIDLISFSFQNTSYNFFQAVPELVIYDRRSVEVDRIVGDNFIAFPEYIAQKNFVNRLENDVVIPDELSSVVLFITSRDGKVLSRSDLSLFSGDRILSNQNIMSPLSPYRERRRFQFLYNPIFQAFALFIGLTLVLGSTFLTVFKK